MQTLTQDTQDTQDTQTNFSYQTKPLLNLLHVREGDAITPEVQALIDKAVEAQVTGLKTKNAELLGVVKESKTALQQAQAVAEKFKNLEGVDLSKVQTLLKNMDSDEDLQMLANGQKQQLIEKHTSRMREDFANQLKQKDDLIKAEQDSKQAYRDRVLDAQILSVATGLHKGAVEDALLVARNIFSLDAKGNAVKLDAEGKPELGKDGKTPYSPSEWMEGQRELKPHWFPAASSGSGAPGNGNTNSGGKTIKRSAFDAMPLDQQAAYMKSKGTLVD
jgi:hypothetical protein